MGQVLHGSFEEFIGNVPPPYLLNQLYMFSEKLDVSEALRNLSQVKMILRTETLNSTGFARLNKEVPGLGLNEQAWYRKSSDKTPPLSSSDRELARERLDREYQLLDLVPD